MAAISPLNVNGVVGTLAPVQPGVQVIGANGTPVSGVSITWTVTSGQGSISPATSVTDARGEARATSWTLGTRAGRHTVTASGTAATARAHIELSAPGSPDVVLSVTRIR